jgi:hypothetical protein
VAQYSRSWVATRSAAPHLTLSFSTTDGWPCRAHDARWSSPWRVAQTLPREWSGLAAQSVPAATALHGGAIAEPQYFGLTPVYDDAEWMVAKQRPRLGLMVGRTAYWKDWEFVRTTLPDDAVALTQPTWRLPGRGALVEVRDQQASVLLTVQLGRDDPLMRHARKSQVLRIRK